MEFIEETGAKFDRTTSDFMKKYPFGIGGKKKLGILETLRDKQLDK